jgi:hypothetical protein
MARYDDNGRGLAVDGEFVAELFALSAVSSDRLCVNNLQRLAAVALVNCTLPNKERLCTQRVQRPVSSSVVLCVVFSRLVTDVEFPLIYVWGLLFVSFGGSLQ